MFFFKKKEKLPASKAEGGSKLVRRLNHEVFAYVSERDETYKETIVSKRGYFTIDGNDVVVSGESEILRCPINEADVNELLSLDGVIVKGIDKNTGMSRTVVCYYSHYVSKNQEVSPPKRRR